MKGKNLKLRKSDRDVFYTEIAGFDTHDNIATRLSERLIEVNDGLEAFVTEMKDQNIWDDTAIVVVSEFARTLMPNTGLGSDHAWGGIPFIAGGKVKGGQILGEFPPNLATSSRLVFEPGIVIPTLPFEAMWNGIAEWFGVTNSVDLSEVLPNKEIFQNDLFIKSDLFL